MSQNPHLPAPNDDSNPPPLPPLPNLPTLTLHQAAIPQLQLQGGPQQAQIGINPFIHLVAANSYAAFPNSNPFVNAMFQQQQLQAQLLQQQAMYPGLFAANIPSPTNANAAVAAAAASTNRWKSTPSPDSSESSPQTNSPFHSSKPASALPSQCHGPPLRESQLPNPLQVSSTSGLRPEMPPPKWYDKDVMLGVEEDKYYLSELQCILRREFIEAFGTSQTDIILPVMGRNKPIALGQVGLRCKHCKDLLSCDRAPHAVTYPSFVSSIYNSVKQMFRLHFDHCELIPADLREKVGRLKDSTANRGGRKQYWVDSAKRIGLVDTNFGIHFGRDPDDPLPPIGNLPLDSLDDDDMSHNSYGDDGSPLKIDFYGSQDVQEPDYYPLVLPEDKPLISDYLYLALEQMQPANLMDADRVGCYKGRRTGFPGLACKHCVGQAGCGRYFPASEASLSQTTTSQTLVNHVRNCRRCPIEVREELELMKRAKTQFESKNHDNKPRHGGRKVFFHRLWCRIQRIPLPKHEKADGETPHKPPKKEKSSPSSRKRKKSVDDVDDEDGSVRKSAKQVDDDGSEIHEEDYDINKASMSPSHDSQKSMISAYQGSARLSRGDDASWLSESCCFVRAELVEAFTATEEEVDGITVTSPGQVGIRCVYCAKNPLEERPKGHAYYPSSVAGVQDAVSDLQRRHLQICNEIPVNIRDTYRALKGSGAKRDGDTAQYWVDSAKELGLCDYEGGRGEVMFFRNPHELSPADEVDLARKNDAPTGSYFVLPEDRDACTDHIVLLLKQFTPCRFESTDRRGGSTKSRDRALGFPGLMCTHCTHKRYFPVAEKKVSDTTNLMMTHITNCFSSPLTVKASLCYLQHRSMIQKAQLMGNWKITFFKRVWNRLHHQKWDDSSFTPEPMMDASTSGEARHGEHGAAGGKADGREKDSGEIMHAEGNPEEITVAESHEEEERVGNADEMSKMQGLITAAALWLTERDAEAEARARSGRGMGSVQTVRPAGRGGRGRGGRGRGGRKG